MDKEELKQLLSNKAMKYTDEEKVNILIQINDVDFIIDFLAKEKIGQSAVIELLKTMDNSELIKRCIRDKDIKIQIEDKYLLALRINDSEYILKDIKRQKLNLPKDISFGIEIESEGENSRFILEEFNLDGWEAKRDNSLENGVEITSPVLNSNNKNIKQIYMVNEVLKKIGQDETEKCAGHIHMGADYLKSKQAFINLMEIWHNSDKIIYAICNGKREVPRTKIVNFAAPISNEIIKVLQEGTITLEDEGDLFDFVNSLKMLQALAVGEKTGGKARNSGLNLLNVHTAKNTIEFRVPNGTLDADLWIDNVNLFGRIMITAQELAEIQKNSELGIEEKNKLMLFNKLKSNIDERQRAEALFDLIEVDSQLYINKYNANIKLFNKSPWLNIIFDERRIVELKSPRNKVMVCEIGEVAATSEAIIQQEAQENIIESYEENKRKNMHKDISK